MNLVCQGAGGSGGQDWDGPHLLVGRLVLGHTARGEVVGGVDRSLSGQWSQTTSAGLLGQTPPTIFRSCGEDVCRFGGRRNV